MSFNPNDWRVNSTPDSDGNTYTYQQQNDTNWEETNGMPPIRFPDEASRSTTGGTRTMAIVALVLSLTILPLVGFILGIIALTQVKKATREIGYQTKELKTAKTCAILAIVFGVLGMALNALSFLFELSLL